MGVLSEVPATVEVEIADLRDAGLALAMWDAARRRDQRSGSVVMVCAEPGELVGSAACLVVTLLRRAGHHHYGAHDEVRHGGRLDLDAPHSRPLLSHVCPEPYLDDPVCGCDVETAARILAPVVAGTPASSPLAQVAAQFTADRTRSTVTLIDVNVAQATVLLEASALLVAHRWGGTCDEVMAEARAQVLAAQDA